MFFRVETNTDLEKALSSFAEFLREIEIPDESIFHGKLAFSELVGNILKHSKSFAKVYSEVKDDFIELKIYAADGYTPPKTSRCADVLSEGGRGLFLVDSVSFQRISLEDGGIKILIKIAK